MLEIRHMREGETEAVSRFIGGIIHKTIEFSQFLMENPQYKVITAFDDGEVLAVFLYHESFDFSCWNRGLSVDFYALSGTLAGELERCIVSVLIQKAMREGYSFVSCNAQNSGFIAENFPRRYAACVLNVAEDGWRVLQLANRCMGRGQ